MKPFPSGVPDDLGPALSLLVERSAGALADGMPPGYSSRILGPADEPALQAFRRSVLAGLHDPEHYRLDAEVGNFVADHLGRLGVTAGVFAGDRLAAYGVLNLPRPGDHNRGRGLLPEEELDRVAYAASAMVGSDQRGRGLHHRLIRWRLDVALLLGRAHVLANAYPGNHQSWAHLASHGMYAKRMLRVGNGLVRLLVHRDLRCRPSLDVGTVELCPVEALGEQWDRFDRGLWLWGRCWVEGRAFALFGRPLAGSARRDEQPAAAIAVAAVA